MIRAAGTGDVSGLTGLLVSCVAAGASVGFLADVTRSDAQAFWRTRLADPGTRVLVDVDGGVVRGTVSLVLVDRPNGRHRAEVATLLVAPEVRRQGLGRRLLRAAEELAGKQGRTLLVLDTATGSPAQALYESAGYLVSGVVPDYAAAPDGRLEPTTVLFKRLEAGGAPA